MCVCMHVPLYVCLLWLSAQNPLCVCRYVCRYAGVRVPVWVHMPWDTRIHVYMYMDAGVSLPPMCLPVWMFVYVCVVAPGCLYACEYVYACMRICNPVCLYVCHHACGYGCVHACMCVYVFVCGYPRMIVYLNPRACICVRASLPG